MAVSEVQICNNALIKVGSDIISSLTENTKGAKLCNQLYSILRDELLRMHPWNFAVKRVQLAAESTAPDFEFTYQYQLPSDFLRLLDVYNYSTRYRVEGDKVLSDDDTIQIIYIAQITDPQMFDSAFSEVLATRLASEIAYSLSGSRSLADSLTEIYSRKLSMAKMADAQENYNDSLRIDTYLDARFQGASEEILLHGVPT